MSPVNPYNPSTPITPWQYQVSPNVLAGQDQTKSAIENIAKALVAGNNTDNNKTQVNQENQIRSYDIERHKQAVAPREQFTKTPQGAVMNSVGQPVSQVPANADINTQAMPVQGSGVFLKEDKDGTLKPATDEDGNVIHTGTKENKLYKEPATATPKAPSETSVESVHQRKENSARVAGEGLYNSLLQVDNQTHLPRLKVSPSADLNTKLITKVKAYLDYGLDDDAKKMLADNLNITDEKSQTNALKHIKSLTPDDLENLVRSGSEFGISAWVKTLKAMQGGPQTGINTAPSQSKTIKSKYSDLNLGQ
jgi:hypothetical protein